MNLSEYLLRSEYECSHCHALPPDLFLHDIKRPYSELFHIFDAVRAIWGAPIPISRHGGYRCPFCNTEVRGSQLSAHMFGLALDCDMSTVEEVEELYILLERDFPHLRIGKYVDTATFIHFDIAYVITPRASHNWQQGARWYK